MKARSPSLAGWTPIAAEWVAGRPRVRWCYTEGIEFTDPFFDQTVERCLENPFRLLFGQQTDGDVLEGWAAESPGLTLSGLIFHLSRCGSTLVTQMLGALDETLVLSEPPVLDDILRASYDPGLRDNDIAAWLRVVVSALGQPRREGQTHLVVKLDAWAIFQWPLIRQAFPATPCIFLYRDPLEILVSHLGHRGFHMIPGTLPHDLLGLSAAAPTSLTAERYGAIVLRRLSEAALAAARAGQVELLNYRALPQALADTIVPCFGLGTGSAAGPGAEAVLAAIAERDAKNPVNSFVADVDGKQARATGVARAAVDAEVRPVYDALEALRTGSR